MNNIYKVNYRGKEFIGQIRNIDAIYYQDISVCGDRNFIVKHYSVSIVEKDTGVIIMGIIINKLSDLEEIK